MERRTELERQIIVSSESVLSSNILPRYSLNTKNIPHFLMKTGRTFLNEILALVLQDVCKLDDDEFEFAHRFNWKLCITMYHTHSCPACLQDVATRSMFARLSHNHIYCLPPHRPAASRVPSVTSQFLEHMFGN
jgi:hypothetical protein